ncbi:MAG: hypothetical protein JWO53_878 [Chlamydiia bacterium]|nr:hypothetical protein [Chlamydiia bacterium]
MFFLLRLLLCVAILGGALFAYIERHNSLTELRIRVPILTKKLKDLQEENIRLHYEIEKFENPLNLMELARKPQYAYLKHPYAHDIIHLFPNPTNEIAEYSAKAAE